MHELSIALSILDLAAEESQRRDAAPVRAIHVRVGEASGVVPRALVSAFDLAKEVSPFPEVRLNVESVPVACYCDVCRQQQPIESIVHWICSKCGAPATNIVQGRELEVFALELELPTDGVSDQARTESCEDSSAVDGRLASAAVESTRDPSKTGAVEP